MKHFSLIAEHYGTIKYSLTIIQIRLFKITGIFFPHHAKENTKKYNAKEKIMESSFYFHS